MTTNLTDEFIEEIYMMSRENFPETVTLQAKKCLLDYIGVTLAGAKTIQQKGNKLLDTLQTENGNLTAIGFKRKTNIQNAALINGLSAHVIELDDGMRFGMLHPGSPIFSALLPLAEKEKLSGEALIRGIIIGYEAAIRTAYAMQPAHKERGYHTTGTCGTIGSAMAIAAALKYDKKQIKNTLSAAATGAAGLLESIEDGSELKPYNAAHAALSGLTAAAMGKAGFNGPDDVLGGKRGFFQVLTENYDITRLKKAPEAPYGIEKIYVKPYAACRHCHPAMEAAHKITSNTNITPEEIQEIKVETYSWAVLGHDHTSIQGITSAKMSIPYSVAAIIALGKGGIDEFSQEKINNPQITELTKKVAVISDDELTALVPEKRAATVHITTADKQNYTERVDYPKGEPENPLTEEELKEKFIALATYGDRTSEEVENIIKTVWSIENDIEKLYQQL